MGNAIITSRIQGPVSYPGYQTTFSSLAFAIGIPQESGNDIDLKVFRATIGESAYVKRLRLEVNKVAEAKLKAQATVVKELHNPRDRREMTHQLREHTFSASKKLRLSQLVEAGNSLLLRYLPP